MCNRKEARVLPLIQQVALHNLELVNGISSVNLADHLEKACHLQPKVYDIGGIVWIQQLANILLNIMGIILLLISRTISTMSFLKQSLDVIV